MQELLYKNERENVKNGVLLDANEHYKQWVLPPANVATTLNRYPELKDNLLTRELSERYCSPLAAENILLTAGSIDAIELLVRSIKPTSVIINIPGYDIYKQRARLADIPVKEIHLTDEGQPDSGAILDQGEKDDLLILIHPNNPTGKLIDRNTVKNILSRFEGMIVIDEAYIEYAGLHNSYQDYVARRDNIIILRTFSKAWGLAGVRLGYVLASSHTIELMRVYQNPYSVSSVAIEFGLQAMHQRDQLQSEVYKTLTAKKAMLGRLHDMNILASDSDANFLIVEVDNASQVCSVLRSRNIIIRQRQNIKSNVSFLRITVGGSQDNQKFLAAISGVL